jgi:hypothetical protein
MKPGRKKGTKKTGGRSIGTPNRTTAQAKELLEQIMFGQIDNINDALDNLKDKDYAKYLDACSKLFTYVLPKKSDVTSDGEKIVQQLPIIEIKVNGD